MKCCLFVQYGYYRASNIVRTVINGIEIKPFLLVPLLNLVTVLIS